MAETIGYGKTYPGIADWWAAHPDFTAASWAGELYPSTSGGSLEYSSTAQIDIAGDGNATYYGSLKPASGYGFKDNANKLTNALRYNASNGVGIKKTSLYGAALNITSSYFRLEGVQVSGGSQYNVIALNLGSSGKSNIVARDCILSSASGSYTLSLYYAAKIVNTVVINEANGKGVRFFSGANELLECTVFGLGGSGTPGVEIYFTATSVIKNTAIFGFTRSAASGTYGAASGYNASNDAYMPGSNNQESKTASNQFENISSLANLDLRAKDGDLDLNGTRDQTNTNDLDIVGQARSTTTPTIGAWEVITSGSTSVVPILMRHYRQRRA